MYPWRYDEVHFAKAVICVATTLWGIPQNVVTMHISVFTQETRGWFGLGFSGEIPKTVNPKKSFDSSCHPFSQTLVKILREEFNFSNDDEILSNIHMIDNMAWYRWEHSTRGI